MAVQVIKGRHGSFICLDNDQYVGRSLIAYGEFSELEWALLRKLIEPGDVVVEAGANLGAFTVPLAQRVGPQGRVYAFEPQRLVYQMLCGNLALNAIENVYAFSVAVGDRSGQVRIPRVGYDVEANFGGVGLSNDPDGDVVTMGTVDSLKLGRLDLLKADVEGTEQLVLRGAEGTLKRIRPPLYLENDRREQSPALLAYLFSLGYEAWWHTPPLFNPDNYFGNKSDLFGAVSSINIICWHKDRPAGRPNDVEQWRVKSVDEWPLPE